MNIDKTYVKRYSCSTDGIWITSVALINAQVDGFFFQRNSNVKSIDRSNLGLTAFRCPISTPTSRRTVAIHFEFVSLKSLAELNQWTSTVIGWATVAQKKSVLLYYFFAPRSRPGLEELVCFLLRAAFMDANSLGLALQPYASRGISTRSSRASVTRQESWTCGGFQQKPRFPRQVRPRPPKHGRYILEYRVFFPFSIQWEILHVRTRNEAYSHPHRNIPLWDTISDLA